MAAEEADENSILKFYRKCLSLRKHSKTLIYGTYREYFSKHPRLFVYERALGTVRYLIFCSFSHLPEKAPFPKAYTGKKGELVLSNYEYGKKGELRPYETRVYRYRFPG